MSALFASPSTLGGMGAGLMGGIFEQHTNTTGRFIKIINPKSASKIRKIHMQTS